MAQEDLDSVRRLLDAWARGDWTEGAEFFHDDVLVTTFDADGDEIELHSLSALRDWVRNWLKDWRDVRQEYYEVLDLGDRYLSIGRQKAEGRVSGAPAEMPIFNLFVFRDGKVAEFHTTRYEEVARRRAGINPR